MASAIGLRQKQIAVSLCENNPSITLKIRNGVRLCIERDSPKLFKLFYEGADNFDGSQPVSVGTVRLKDLQQSLSLLCGCFSSAVIRTDIGDLAVDDYRHAERLRKWLKYQNGNKE